LSLSHFKKKNATILFLITGISLLLYLGILSSQSIYSGFGIRDTTSFEFYSPLERFWEFGVGGIIWLMNTKIRKTSKNLNIAVVGFLILLLFSVLTFVGSGNDKVDTLIMVTCVLLVIHKRICDFLPKYFRTSLFWLGDRSYSIYLVHMPVVFLIDRSPYVDFETNISQSVFKLLAFVIVIATGHLIFIKV
jgi:peptidoglycan/LPS O-acetylase OafA/YrhL